MQAGESSFFSRVAELSLRHTVRISESQSQLRWFQHQDGWMDGT